MFTGLIEALGAVVAVTAEPPGKRLVIRAADVAAGTAESDIAVGDSVAINGCCLTVVEASGDTLGFQAGPETLARTNLGALASGHRVNLERSLRVGDRLGGHFVTGHVDGIGTLEERQDERDWSTFWFRSPAELMRQMVSKGSIAVDGISLTLVDVTADRFSVALIPHTLAMTTLGTLKVGDRVNLETDLLAKYVQRAKIKLRNSLHFTPTPSSMSAGQTISFLKRRFTEVGLRLNHRHGQNFLIDLNLIRLLVDRAELGPNDVILEVGTGTGGLTALMAPHVAAVVTVEIDPHLHQLASEELADHPNVTLLRQDALKNKNHLDPRLLDAVKAQLAVAPNRQLKLVANLPYSVATPIISNLLASDVVPRTMTVTIQKELAERIIAEPSTKDYSALSIWIQCQCRAEIVRILPPSVFWPRPKVSSAFIHIEVDDERRRRIPDLKFVHEFVRALFCHRRKFLRSVLVSVTKEQLDKADVDRILAELKLDEKRRAEELDVATLLALSEAVRSACGPPVAG